MFVLARRLPLIRPQKPSCARQSTAWRSAPARPVASIASPAPALVIGLRHPRTFVAAAEDLGFRKAAQRLPITQPALSRQIRGLKRPVGCDLFRRSSAGLI